MVDDSELGGLGSLDPATTTLSNGAVLLAIPTRQNERIVLGAELRVGSRFESAKTNGISHFLEHMVFRGTPCHPSAVEQALAFEDLGGTLDAATSVDTGSLSICVPRESFDSTLPIFAEVLQSPLLSDVDIERGIVTEEILEGLDDDGRVIDADNLIRELAFEGHPLGLPITGTLEQLDSFDGAGLRCHHTEFYVGANTVIFAAGPLDPQSTLRALEARFTDLPPGARATALPPERPSQARFRHVSHAASQTAIRLACPAPSIRDRHEPAAALLARILDDGMSTRLYSEICDKLGLCYDVSGHYEAYEDSGIIELSAESAHDRAEAVLAQMLAILSDLREHGPRPAELERAKRRHRWQLRDLLDSPELAGAYFASSALHGLERSLCDRSETVNAVTAAQVQQVAAECFAPQSLSVVCVGLLSARKQARLQHALA